MRPKLLLVLTLILLAACGGQPTADGQASQTQVEVTRLVEVEVTRLVETEVEVTRLVETVVTPAPAPTSPPPPTAEINLAAYIAGSNITPDDLPAGDPGLSVILTGAPSDFGNIPVVVRNNTDAPVYNIEISATARDASGTILGTGLAILLAPSYIPPGGIAFGTVAFQDTPLDGADLEYLVTGNDAPASFLARRDLEIVEHNLIGDNIAGLLLNSNTSPLDLIQVAVICFDDTGTPVATPSSFTDQDRVDAGAELPFSVDLFGNAAQCGRYLLAAHGFETD